MMQRRSQHQRLGIFCILVAAVALAVAMTPLQSLLLAPQFWVARLQQLGPWAAKYFVLAYIVLTVLGLRGTILTVVGGVVFGLV